MDQNLPPLIQALLQSGRYPGAVQQVELVQTHISWVLLAGDFAYKIKKPVNLGFLDFSTLALRLNRRFDETQRLDRVCAASRFGAPEASQATLEVLEQQQLMIEPLDAQKLDEVRPA